MDVATFRSSLLISANHEVQSPEQASLFRSGFLLDSPLEGQLLWDLASITPGLTRSYLSIYFLSAIT